MKNNRVVLAIFGAVLAALGVGQAHSAPINLQNAVTFVQLDWQARPAPAGGGGVSEFKVGNYAVGGSELLGPTDNIVYATCIEENQWLRKGNEWYAVFIGLVDAPSLTNGINQVEQDIIARVIAANFGDDFKNTTNTDFVSADVAALQAMLWQAGDTPGDDLSNGVSDNGAGNGSGARADTWIDTHENDPAPNITLYSLISVKLKSSANDTSLEALLFSDFEIVGGYRQDGQDFVTYIRGGGPTIPLPAPLLLIGAGLLGLHTMSRRRAK